MCVPLILLNKLSLAESFVTGHSHLEKHLVTLLDSWCHPSFSLEEICRYESWPHVHERSRVAVRTCLTCRRLVWRTFDTKFHSLQMKWETNTHLKPKCAQRPANTRSSPATPTAPPTGAGCLFKLTEQFQDCSDWIRCVDDAVVSPVSRAPTCVAAGASLASLFPDTAWIKSSPKCSPSTSSVSWRNSTLTKVCVSGLLLAERNECDHMCLMQDCARTPCTRGDWTLYVSSCTPGLWRWELQTSTCHLNGSSSLLLQTVHVIGWQWISVSQTQANANWHQQDMTSTSVDVISCLLLLYLTHWCFQIYTDVGKIEIYLSVTFIPESWESFISFFGHNNWLKWFFFFPVSCKSTLVQFLKFWLMWFHQNTGSRSTMFVPNVVFAILINHRDFQLKCNFMF